jgi:hypothetical protein
MSWVMQNVFPYATGVTVDGVIYQYTASKLKDNPMGVTIQNYNNLNDGYVFRHRDDWTGLRGTTITRIIPVDNIPSNMWGNGEIKVDGIGEVKNYSVFYKYRYDTCIINVLSSPSCPGYAEAMAKTLKITEPTIIADEMKNSNDISTLCLPKDIVCLENKPEKTESVKEKKNKDDSRKLIVNLLLNSKDSAMADQLEAMSAVPELYKVSLPGGTYKDVANYPEKRLPDSISSRRLGFAQERLHQSLVDLQYENR